MPPKRRLPVQGNKITGYFTPRSAEVVKVECKPEEGEQRWEFEASLRNELFALLRREAAPEACRRFFAAAPPPYRGETQEDSAEFLDAGLFRAFNEDQLGAPRQEEDELRSLEREREPSGCGGGRAEPEPEPEREADPCSPPGQARPALQRRRWLHRLLKGNFSTGPRDV